MRRYSKEEKDEKFLNNKPKALTQTPIASPPLKAQYIHNITIPGFRKQRRRKGGRQKKIICP